MSHALRPLGCITNQPPYLDAGFMVVSSSTYSFFNADKVSPGDRFPDILLYRRTPSLRCANTTARAPRGGAWGSHVSQQCMCAREESHISWDAEGSARASGMLVAMDRLRRREEKYGPRATVPRDQLLAQEEAEVSPSPPQSRRKDPRDQTGAPTSSTILVRRKFSFLNAILNCEIC